MDLRTANVTRYILPLREGGSLPALAEADDEFKYVVKFRGAGHGTKALIAELIGGEIARALGFRVPEIVFLNLDEAFGRTEYFLCLCASLTSLIRAALSTAVFCVAMSAFSFQSITSRK